ncbi:hypothetical protein [Pseudonocardia phyllosphaerae]|uniref:hypothetical protein n=1 Tax=Pseudonocardia phyllosphaerae TaxID=3390502 RepID=UPI003979D237
MTAVPGAADLPLPVLFALVVPVLVVEAGLPVGAFVPGTLVALTAGALAGGASLPVAVAAVAAGTVAGGQLGFRIGRARRGRAAPFAVATRLPRGPWRHAGRLLAGHPVLTVATGQWLSWGRVVTPRVAGWAAVPPGRFTVVHSVSATTWAAVLTTLGHLTGEAARESVTSAYGLVTAVAGALLTVLLVGLRRRRRGQRRATSTQSSADGGRCSVPVVAGR